MSKLKDALYDSLHSSSHDALHNAFSKFLRETLKGGKDDIRSLAATSKEVATRAHLPEPRLLLLAGVAGLAAAIYFYCKDSTQHETKAVKPKARPRAKTTPRRRKA